jgi:hypothetical protein
MTAENLTNSDTTYLSLQKETTPSNTDFGYILNEDKTTEDKLKSMKSQLDFLLATTEYSSNNNTQSTENFNTGVEQETGDLQFKITEYKIVDHATSATLGEAMLATNATSGKTPIDSINNGEPPQKRIDRLVAEVYEDYNGLPKGLKITAVPGIGIDGDKDIHGRWESQDEILIAYENRDDSWIKGIIFHELLHVDEARHIAWGGE